MKVTVHLDVEARDHSTLLFEDISDVIALRLHGSRIHWHDPSLGREVDADISVSEIIEGRQD